ncbi:MAG: hypothetical protein H0V82_03070 [Candidatus Protochlamydia sp.]|nr:hypothetical protein [Candidatus Protochlamydia sp.]
MSMQKEFQMNQELFLGYLKDIQRNAIKALKDEGYQRRVWFRAEGPEVSSYIDTTIHFIDRFELIFDKTNCSKYLGEKNYFLLKRLYNLILEHVDSTQAKKDADELQEHELLDDPRWHDIQTLAGEIDLILTDYIKRNNNE